MPSVVATFIKVYTTTIKCNDKLWQVVGTITCHLKAIVPCMKSNACHITINTKLIGLVFNIFDRRGYGILSPDKTNDTVSISAVGNAAV